MKVIFAVVKQLQLQRKPRKKYIASTGFEPMTSTTPVGCSTDCTINPFTSIFYPQFIYMIYNICPSSEQYY